MIDDIYRMECSSKYAVRISNLYKLRNQKHKNLIENYYEGKTNMMVEAVNSAKIKDYIVSIELEEDEIITGKINEVDIDEVYITSVGLDGKEEGKVIIKTDQIVLVHIDSLYESSIKLFTNDQFKMYSRIDEI